jgi:hypothetical protein
VDAGGVQVAASLGLLGHVFARLGSYLSHQELIRYAVCQCLKVLCRVIEVTCRINLADGGGDELSLLLFI